MLAGRSRAPVWDLPTRFVHWGLLGTVAIAAATGYLAPEWWMGVHLWAGYAVGGLVLVRLVHGLFGPGPSRFASLVVPPRAVLGHMRRLVRGRAQPHFGHNPAGATMAVALLVVLIGIVATGLVVLGGEEDLGPLAGLVDYATGSAAKTVHYVLAGLLLAMVAVHLLGVMVESRLLGENLALAMITGRKRVADPAPARHRPARPRAAASAFVVLAVLIGSGLATLAAIRPPGPPAPPITAAYRAACGECHYAYHPTLLPARSWRGLMAGLADHFGEDASLDGATAREVTDYLTTHSAETRDTEAANRFRAVTGDRPWRITATPFWRRKHGGIAAPVFARRAVGAASNCPACHLDAETGLFADQKIAIPEEQAP